MSIYQLLESVESGSEPDVKGEALALQEIRDCAESLYGASGAPEIRRLAVRIAKILCVPVSSILTQSISAMSKQCERLAVIA